MAIEGRASRVPRRRRAAQPIEKYACRGKAHSEHLERDADGVKTYGIAGISHVGIIDCKEQEKL